LKETTLKDDDQPDNVYFEVLAEIFVVLDFKNPARKTLKR
jgi:hypothetical protein